MNKIGVIIPDRGDRAELTQFCLKQLSGMTYHPYQIFHINYEPIFDRCDIVPRIRKGILQAMKLGIDWCFIIENDDAYPADYFERYLPYMNRYDFIGDEQTTYYNIFTKSWQTFEHQDRASLFTTAFKVSALDNFEWPGIFYRFLDIPLWEYAMEGKRVKFVDSGAVGIKHGIGKCGGLGHVMSLSNQDPNMVFLKTKVSSSHIDFYSNLQKECDLV